MVVNEHYSIYFEYVGASQVYVYFCEELVSNSKSKVIKIRLYASIWMDNLYNLPRNSSERTIIDLTNSEIKELVLLLQV